MNIIFPDSLKKNIREHGEEGYPHEICGAMIGHMSDEIIQVEHLFRLENLREENTERRYEVTPQDQLKAQQKADENNMDVVGFYHSHPDHPARPSQYDLDHAWPKYLYTIVSVEDGQAADINTWRLNEKGDEFEHVD